MRVLTAGSVTRKASASATSTRRHRTRLTARLYQTGKRDMERPASDRPAGHDRYNRRTSDDDARGPAIDRRRVGAARTPSRPYARGDRHTLRADVRPGALGAHG